ncbi:MAG: (deoxy)nucleoside triphosphate pyrophosphohydrolase [Candidatus Riflebacteria bacterium]|nr:(deoxy)nucleoside triphosphate pyrophosphohydrolase [Candidatus Riflebacteria bacterium]
MASYQPIEVVAGVVVFEGKVLIAKRKCGLLNGLWEFPGGKTEKDESYFAAIIRELDEELGLSVEPEKKLLVLQHEYPDKTVLLHFIKCFASHESISKITPELIEKNDICWIHPQEFDTIDFCPADKIAVQQIAWSSLIT